MSVSRPGEAFADDGDDTDDSDVPPGLEESIVEESIASGLPELIFSSSEDAPVDAGQQSESDEDCTDDDMIDPLHPLIAMLHNLNFEPMLSLQEPRGYAPFSGLRQGFLNKRKDAALTATAKGPVASGNSYSLRRQIAALDEKMTAVRNENAVLREKRNWPNKKSPTRKNRMQIYPKHMTLRRSSSKMIAVKSK